MKKFTNLYKCILLVIFACLLADGYSQVSVARSAASAFTPGNLVIYRVGDGVSTLINTGNAVFLDEYTPTGTLVQSIPMPTTASGGNFPLVASGSASSEGLMALSADKQYLILAGYGATIPYASSLVSTASTVVPRVIGVVSPSGTINTTTALSDAATGNNPRGACSTNGTDLWISGGAGGVRYATLGTTTSSQLSTTPTNIRAINVFDGQLYASSASGAFRLLTIGTGTPTTSGQTSTNLPGFPTSGGSPYGFYFADLSASVVGVDVVYVADDGGLLYKYSLVGGNWVSNGTITIAAVRCLTGSVTGTTATLYATSATTSSPYTSNLYSIVDATGYNIAITATPTLLSTVSSTSMAWRGIAFAPASSVTAPTVQTNNITFSAIANTSMTVNYTAGNGAKRIVKMNTSNSFTNPADGTDPTANTVYSGSGEQVVYNNTGNSVSVTGLTPGTTYWFRAYEYNGTGSSTKYLTTTATLNPNSQVTTSLPTAVTNAATAILSTGATLNGTVNASNSSTTVTFEYGLTVAYGSTINATPNIVTGTTDTPVSANVTGLVIGNTYHFRVKAVNDGGTADGNDMTFLTGCTIPPAPGTITGNASVCQGTSGVIYSVGAIFGADTYIWTVPSGATITAGAGTNSITVSYSPTAVSGNITVKGSNDCGAGAISTLAVTVNPLPTPTLAAGPLSSCLGTTGVIYSTQPGMTGYTWTISAGGTITAGAGTSSITVSWNVAGAQTISLNYTNATGCTASAPVVFNITVANRPVPTITGSANACLGFTNNVYTTQAGNSGYTWTVSAGGAITAGATTNAITVTWSTVGAKVVTVNYTIPAGCNANTPASFNVNVNQTPSPTITGTTSLCAGTTGVTYTTEPGYSNYVWSISYDGVITSGLNTNTVTVNWPTAGTRNISVNYTNASGCSAVTSTTKSVSVLSVPVPMIFGQNAVCQGATGVTYNTQAGNSNYLWTVSSGGTITSGAGTNTIAVTWNTAGNQTVSANYTNSLDCPAAQPTVYNVVVAPLPAAGGTITGSASVCSGAQGVAYSVPAIANATTYNWTLPAGVSIATGATTNAITVNFSATAASGVIKVNGVNTCGNGVNSPNFNVTINPLPTAPVITQVPVGDTLISSVASGNQWYLNGVAIAGATGKKYLPVHLGTYTDILTVNGCNSLPSNAIIVTQIVAVHDLGISSLFDLYPNPSKGQFNIKVVSGKSIDLNIEIYNNLGALVWKQENVHIDGTYIAPIDLGSVPAGVYMVALKNANMNIVRKMVVLK